MMNGVIVWRTLLYSSLLHACSLLGRAIIIRYGFNNPTRLKYMYFFCLPSERMENLYCFSYKMEEEETVRARPWSFFPIHADFERMGVPNEAWALTHVNRNYEVLHPPQLFYSLTILAILNTGLFAHRLIGYAAM